MPSAVSSQIVNGPSLTSATSISAPKRPVATVTRQGAQGISEPEVEPLGELGRRAADEARPASAARIRVERELRDDERATADLEDRQVRPPLGVTEDPQLGDLARQVVGGRLGVVRADPEEDDQAVVDRTHDLAIDPDRRPRRPLQQRPHGWLGGGMTPCSAMKASRQASASRS